MMELIVAGILIGVGLMFAPFVFGLITILVAGFAGLIFKLAESIFGGGK